MKVVDLRTTVLSIPFVKPMVWPYGVWPGVTVVIVELEANNGLVGIGESSPMQRPVEAALGILEAAKPYVVGEDPFNTERIAKKLHHLAGWHYARGYGNRVLSGIDTALWDLMGKACGQPLYKLLGGAIRKRIHIRKYILKDAPEVMAEEGRKAVAEGYDTLNLKYTTIVEVREALEAIRAAVGPEPKLCIDFNQTLSPGFAVQFINSLRDYNLGFVEQPVSAANIESMAYVRRSVNVPIAGDESCQNLYDTFNVIRQEAADIIYVDPRSHDGILDAKKAAGMAEAAGLPVIAHSAVEAGIAQAMFLHVIASTPNFILPNQSVYENLSDDYITEPLVIEQGHMRVPEGPGVGVALDPDKVARYAEHYREVGSYTTFDIREEELPTIPLRLLPSY